MTKVKIHENDISAKRNKKHPSCLENLSFYFTEYCDNTSIHGLKFLGERGRSVVERIWWIIFLVTSLYFCILLITSTYHKWKNSPVVVTFATSQTPLWKIPFPAVTICPEIKSKRELYNFSKKLLWRVNNDVVDEEENLMFSHMALVCPTLFKLTFSDINVTTDDSVVEFLEHVAPKFGEILFDARWLGNELADYHKVFTPVITSEGVCYTFNVLDRDEIFTNLTMFHKDIGLTNRDPSRWSLEKGYENDADLDTFPKRTLLSGMNGGLELILVTNKSDIDHLCGESIQGYKVILQHPSEIPLANEQYFRVPLDQHVIAAIKPNMMTTSDDLKYYDSEDRQCYFIEEKKLKFFKIYNQQNCLMECLANFTYEYCDCVTFYMPHTNSTPICGPAMINCLSEANALFLADEVTSRIRNQHKRKREIEHKDKTQPSNVCNCLPSCNSLKFEVETSQSDWNWLAPITALNFSRAIHKFHFSRLKMFFKDMQFITSERHQLYGTTDFWANCGGLLGLFTGFSFISVVEILYFSTLRFVCNFRTFGRHYWSGAKELTEPKDD